MFEPVGRTRRLILALTVVVVGACSVEPGSSVQTESGAPAASAAALLSPTPTARPTTSAEATPSPTAEPSATATDQQTIPPEQLTHDDPALEALLPTQVLGVDLVRMSAPGRDYAGGGDVCGFVCPLEPTLMAEGVGAELDDVHVAFAFDPVGHHAIVAWRVDGASGAELRQARIDLADDAEWPYPLIEDFPVGDDIVTVAVRSWFPNDTQFLVQREDAIIVIPYPTDIHDGTEVTLPPEVAEIVAALP